MKSPFESDIRMNNPLSQAPRFARITNNKFTFLCYIFRLQTKFILFVLGIGMINFRLHMVLFFLVLFGGCIAFSPLQRCDWFHCIRMHWVHYKWKLDWMHLQTHRQHRIKKKHTLKRGWMDWCCRWCTWFWGEGIQNAVHFGMLQFSLSIEWLTHIYPNAIRTHWRILLQFFLCFLLTWHTIIFFFWSDGVFGYLLWDPERFRKVHSK